MKLLDSQKEFLEKSLEFKENELVLSLRENEEKANLLSEYRSK